MRQLVLLFAFLIIAQNSFSQTIIPAPQKFSEIKGKGVANILVKDLKSITCRHPKLLDEATLFNEFLMKMHYEPFELKPDYQNTIFIDLDPEMKEGEYSVECKNYASATITGSESGVFYGLMSLLQLIHESKTNPKVTLGNMHDFPSYAWRGMHLDVSRHFFDVDFIKKYIDILALHKMNTFHWHLTDDQGWRIEILKYPLLTQMGSKRKETMLDKNFEPYIGDGKPVEGFYSQEEIRDVVAYATQRHITIVPEIEMPGHALGALNAYPEYSCNHKPLEVFTKWGVSDDVYCPNDSTLKFLENILDEVMELFPSRYIHIGGDEVPKTRWKQCPICQKIIHVNKLKDENELQSYFIKKIDAYVTSKGRSIIGWDEILEGGLAPNAAVMSWRGEEGGIAAAKQKHNVVMTPGGYCYFDHYQGARNTEPLAIGGYTNVEKVYSYNPTPSTLSAEEQKYILGAQGNVWTEYIPTSNQVEYMALPRLCALAEVLWTGKNKPGYNDFKTRLRAHFTLLDTLQIQYAKSIFDVTSSSKISNNALEVSLQTSYTNGKIYYTLDGSEPQKNALNIYTHPISLKKSATLKAQYIEDNENGHVFNQEFTIHKALGKSIISSIAPNKSYNADGMPKLLDARVGHLPRINNEWLGWSGESPVFIIDLKEKETISSVAVATLKQESDWIYLPSTLELYASEDGMKYTLITSINRAEIEHLYSENNSVTFNFSTISTRFLKIATQCAPNIEKNKPGEGEHAWLFFSEIMVN